MLQSFKPYHLMRQATLYPGSCPRSALSGESRDKNYIFGYVAFPDRYGCPIAHSFMDLLHVAASTGKDFWFECLLLFQNSIFPALLLRYRLWDLGR